MIRTKIAQILSPTRFVLAAGKEQDVKEGMEFIIYELGDPVYDPETKESLGELELHKGRLKIIHVQDRLSTAITLKREAYRQHAMSEILNPFAGRWVDEYEQLPIDQSTATATKVNLTVKVGDLVHAEMIGHAWLVHVCTLPVPDHSRESLRLFNHSSQNRAGPMFRPNSTQELEGKSKTV